MAIPEKARMFAALPESDMTKELINNERGKLQMEGNDNEWWRVERYGENEVVGRRMIWI